MERGDLLRVGTRGSALAQIQTAFIVNALQKTHQHIETIVIRTSGDLQQREKIGAFVKELQQALLDKQIDVAVHSLKDLPTQPVDGLVVAAIPTRADARDVLISRGGEFLELPSSARIGSGSVRRIAQLRAIRPDLQYVPLVGNVDTRIRKLCEGEYDAIVLAAAGLQRLGFLESEEDKWLTTPEGHSLLMEILPYEILLPAPGQGALAIECRSADEQAIALLAPLDDLSSRQAITAERSFLQALGGGCRVPIAAYASVEGSGLTLSGLIATPDGSIILRNSTHGQAEDAAQLGEQLAQRLLEAGAGNFWEAAT